ncbi:sigma-70 family RNA polymerase sigma factor [Amycolatopsis sp., V23-08]|uniref:Sigma-70 family RNA polymerase sigma factor n=1 Tax=Amycolatopsis heterodermiae TaxID=3110235 RepID=A0ABU5RGQ8_9PSEU|nr:sigma-70 family RNA polymerase sigma factor [Amycolatopsis sp., V23-08]MEA5365461.1 sigma-70 family RNA polymerase sigma factor [Amycolatopsis sp., V23-08]
MYQVNAEEDTLSADTAVDLAEPFRAHRPGLVRLAVLLLGDRGLAEDVVQDAFVALFKRWPLDDPAGAGGYLRVSVVNGARSAEALLDEEHREVIAAVRQLPRRQRDVLVLRYWSGLSEAEIADTLGVSRSTVKTCASRALAKLKGSSDDRRRNPAAPPFTYRARLTASCRTSRSPPTAASTRCRAA